MDFLATAERLKTKAQNRGLLQALDHYCTDAALDNRQRQEVRQQVHSYCKEKLQAREEIAITEFSATLSPMSDKTFQAFSSEQGYALEETFSADCGTLRPLIKYAASGVGVTLNFDGSQLKISGSLYSNFGCDSDLLIVMDNHIHPMILSCLVSNFET